MTEVVTNAAAYVQPLLYAVRQQAIGASNQDSPQNDIASGVAASQQQHALDAAKVAQAGDDRSSLKQDDESNQSGNRSFANQLPPARPQPKASDLAAPTGPAKARVDIPVFDINTISLAPKTPAPQPTAVSAPLASAQSVTAPVEVHAPKPLTLGTLGGAAAGPAQQAPTEEAKPHLSGGVLGPAAVVKDADLANIEGSIFGAAFAPTQVVQPSADPTPTQSQKNFIFAQRKLFGGDEIATGASGKFVSEEAKAAVFGPDVSSGKFAAQPVAVAAATIGAQFAASADTAQKLFDKGPATTSTAPVDATTNEVRLYDKVAHTDTQGQSGDHNSGAQSEDQTPDSRQSLYERAQAVAQALGDKSSNPAVKKLVSTLESYALITGITPGAGPKVRPTVRVTV